MKVFFPHIFFVIWSVAGFLIFAKLFENRLTDNLKILTLELLVVILIILFIGVVLLLAFMPIVAKRQGTGLIPDTHEIPELTVILGFGYERESNGDIKAGDVNKKLLQQAINNPKTKTILVQEAIWVATKDLSKDNVIQDKVDKNELIKVIITADGREITMRRIHRHDENKYVNTLETLLYTMERMEELHLGKIAILMTHKAQIQRALWDWNMITNKDKSKQDFIALLPIREEIPELYSSKSVHKWTRGKWRYKFFELLVFRPRDFFSPIKLKYGNSLRIFQRD